MGLNVRRFAAIALALAAFLLIAGCGSDPTPTPTPTATATPTPAPTATPTPEPSMAGPGGSLEDMFITDTTIGRDVMSRLSTAETDCLRAALGEEVYNAVLDLPMTTLVRETGSAGAGSFLNCLTEDNVILMGLVLIDTTAGRVDPEACECRVPVARANPDIIRIRYAVLRPALDTLDAEAVLAATKEAFDCFSVADQVGVLLRLTDRLSRQDAFTGQDVISMLSEGEASCIREELGEEQFADFLETPLTEAFAPSPSLLACILPETQTRLFAVFSASRVEGLRPEAVTCMSDTVADSPNILAIGFGTLDADQMEERELAQLGDEAARLFDCLNADEVLQVLTLPAVVE
ncbi:MAG: hypothetical protein OXK79_13810 [Chloroflexota bacterium]|nr:hypothetical protein [Chloroflexota bacterium]